MKRAHEHHAASSAKHALSDSRTDTFRDQSFRRMPSPKQDFGTRAPPRIVEVRHGPKKERMRPISSWAVSVGGYAGLSVREHDVAGDEVGHDARNVPSGAHRVSAAPIELQQARGQVCRSAPVEAQLDVSSKLVAADDTSSSWRPMQSCTYAGAATSETIAIARAATAWASTS